MRLKSPKHYIYHYKILIFYLKKLINRDLEAYHDKIYDDHTEDNNCDSGSESDEMSESEESDVEENISSDDEEADLENLNNNDDLELNDAPFEDIETDIEDDDHDTELKEVLKEIAGLLCKVRSIARFSRKSNIIQIKMKEIIKRYGLEKVNFILDFHVRWNSSFLMIKRFRKLKEVVQVLTNSPIQDIDGLTKPQHKKLESWSLNGNEWQTLDMLENTLLPFFMATKLLSGRKYPTLRLNLLVYRNLKQFLANNPIINPKSKENYLKQRLLKALNFHFETKISDDQKNISLVKIVFLFMVLIPIL